MTTAGGRDYTSVIVKVRGAELLASSLFVIAIPLFLVTSNVRWAVNDLRLYRYGFEKYGVAEVMGIEEGELMRAARQIKDYFNTAQEPLVVRVWVEGEERRLFNEREVQHMRDVKRLVWGVYGVQGGTGLYLLVYAALGLLLHHGPFLRLLAWVVLWGCAITLAFVALVGLASLISFDALFLLFHRVSFANTLWMLDPTRDHLIMMFPEGFWFDATLFVALTTAVEALLLGAAAGVFLLSGRRSVRRGRAD